MDRQSIRNEGVKGEAELRRLIPNAKASPSQKQGDAVLRIDGKDYFIEVKQCVKGNSINQVRAIKFTTLVVYSPQLPKPWAVLAPQEVARIVAEKERGQHNEVALECANLTLTSLPAGCRCSNDELAARVESAIRSSEPYGDLREALARLLDDLVEVKTAAREAVRKALQAGQKGGAAG